MNQRATDNHRKVQEQAKQFETKGTPQYAVKHGCLEDIKKVFPPGCKHSLLWFEQQRRKRDAPAAPAPAPAPTTALPPGRPEPAHPGLSDSDLEVVAVDDGRAPGQGPVAREESPSQMPKSASFLGPQGMSAQAEGYDVYTRGQVGDNIFHLCMLLNTKTTRKMAKYLVEVFGTTLVNTPYQERNCADDPPGMFEGEVALHLAIVNQQVDMVEFFLKHQADVFVRAYGSFFAPASETSKGNCYYGEYPMSFAVSTGNIQIVKILSEHVKDVNQHRDSQGNYALHMAVIHDKFEMYGFLVDNLKASQQVRNVMAFTPIELAAYMGKRDMFQYIAVKRGIVAWKFGIVTCRQLPLTNIDTVQDTEEEASVAALNTIIEEKHFSMIRHPFVVWMLQQKWQTFAWVHFWGQLVYYCVDIAVLTHLVVYVRYGFLWPRDNQWSYRPVLAPNIWSGGGVHCENEQDPDDPFNLRAFNCNIPDEDWVFGPGRFRSSTGVGLEVASFALTLFNVCLEIFDYYNSNRLYQMQESYSSNFTDVNPTPKVFPIPGVPTNQKLATVASRNRGRSASWNKVAADLDQSMPVAQKTRIKRMDDTLKMYGRVLGSTLSLLPPTSVFLWVSSIMRCLHFVTWLSGKPLSGSQQYHWELAVAALFGWLYALHFARGFKRIGHLVVMMERIVMDDLVGFLMVYGLCLMGFSSAFFLLVRYEFVDDTTMSMPGDYNTLFAAMITLFRTMLGDMSYFVIRNSGLPNADPGIKDQYPNMPLESDVSRNINTLAIVFYIFWLALSIILINLLIALMSSTYERIQSQAHDQWLLNYAIIIQKIERRLPESVRKQYRLGEPLNPLETEHYHTIQEVDKSDSTLVDDSSSSSGDEDEQNANTVFAHDQQDMERSNVSNATQRRAPSEKTQKLNDKIGNMISGLVKRQVRKRMEITGAATFSDSLPENAMDSLFEEAGTSRNQWHRRVH